MGEKNKNYIDQWQDWQEHQYQPGYYVGSKINPVLIFGKDNLFWGLLHVVLSLGMFFVFFFLIYLKISATPDSNYNSDNLIIDLIILCFVFFLASLYLFYGV